MCLVKLFNKLTNTKKHKTFRVHIFCGFQLFGLSIIKTTDVATASKKSELIQGEKAYQKSLEF